MLGSQPGGRGAGVLGCSVGTLGTSLSLWPWVCRVKGWIRSQHDWAWWYCWRAFEVRRLLVADNQGWCWHWASACPLWALCLLLMPWPHSTQLEQCLRHSRLRCCLQLLCASWGVRSLRVSRFWGLSIPRLFQLRDFCGSSVVQRWGDWFGHSVTFPG